MSIYYVFFADSNGNELKLQIEAMTREEAKNAAIQKVGSISFVFEFEFQRIETRELRRDSCAF